MKKWWGRTFGAPTLEQLMDDLCLQLERLGWKDIHADLARAGIDASRHGRRSHFAVADLLVQYQRADRRDRRELIRRFAGAAPAQADPVPSDYAQARPMLMPLVRTLADVGLARLKAQSLLRGMQAFRPMLWRPFIGELVLALGCDLPGEALAWVPEDRLAQWGRSFEQVWADALLNLRALPEQPGWTQIAHGVWAGDWADGFQSSRMLLPDLIHRLGVPEPVAMVPFRNTLLVASANDPHGVRRMGEAVAQVAPAAPGWMSFEPMRLRQRDWAAHEVPADDRAFFTGLREQGRMVSYRDQKALIDSQAKADAAPPHVAEYHHVQHDADDAMHSVALWREGVDSLLPVTDWLALLPADESRDPILARWRDVHDVAGGLLESTDHLPPRVRVRGFPSVDEERDLRGRMARGDLV